MPHVEAGNSDLLKVMFCIKDSQKVRLAKYAEDGF